MNLRGKQRLACRYALLIQALGTTPVAYSHKDMRSYLQALYTQYTQLLLQVGPEMAKQARKAVTRTITEHSLSGAAKGLVPDLQLLNCQRKIVHRSFTTALEHVQSLIQISGDTGLQIYSCPVCHEMHVGHKKPRKKHRDEAPDPVAPGLANARLYQIGGHSQPLLAETRRLGISLCIITARMAPMKGMPTASRMPIIKTEPATKITALPISIVMHAMILSPASPGTCP